MSNEAIGGGVFRVPGNELLLILALEEFEHTWAVADNFEVGIVHGQLSEPEDAAAMIDVGRCGERRRERH